MSNADLSSERLRHLFEWSMDLIYLHDGKGMVLDCNRRGYEQLGYTREELMSMSVADFEIGLRQIPKEKLGAEWARMELGIPVSVKGELIRKDGGTLPVELSIGAFMSGEDKLFVAAARDIRDRLEAERQLAEALAQLEGKVSERTSALEAANELLQRQLRERRQAEAAAAKAREAAESANRAKSQFLANMSHELRTPLNAIIGYAEMLHEDFEDLEPDEAREDLIRIEKAGRHLLGLINDVLDISKIEAGKMELHLEDLELEKVIKSVTDTMQPTIAEHRNQLTISIEGALGSIRSDIVKLRQILFNLLSNASKFTEDGCIDLKAYRATRSGRDVVIMEVRDEGVGMDQTTRDRIFKPFIQADASTTRRYGGTGLGLAITHRFCEMLGGEIGVESVLGQGSTFRVILPARAGEQAPRVVRNGRVLVIDDEADARELLSRMLKEEGYQVRAVSSGAEALTLAQSWMPDLVTIDVMMPDMDGWTVLARLKDDPMLSDIPAIMVTMTTDADIGFALGASDFIRKPIERERLVRVARRLAPPPSREILIVDDDEVSRDMLGRTLAGAGYSIRHAANGREGLVAIDALTPSLMLLDLLMPEMDGFELLEELHSRPQPPTFPIVVVTSKDLTNEEREALNARVRAVLTREELETGFLMRVRELVSKALVDELDAETQASS